MLNFDGSWPLRQSRSNPGRSEQCVFRTDRENSNPDNRKTILEHFKDYFASAAGASSTYSYSWAESDLLGHMQHAAANAPLFIEAFYDGCQSVANGRPPTAAPDLNRINRILTETQSGYQIRPPNLISTNVHVPIAVPYPPRL